MDYKGYEGVVNYDEEAKMFLGEVIETKDVINFNVSLYPSSKRHFKVLQMTILSFVFHGINGRISLLEVEPIIIF
jgi:predicted HicB family RNase H-like nuclease